MAKMPFSKDKMNQLAAPVLPAFNVKKKKSRPMFSRFAQSLSNNTAMKPNRFGVK